MTVFPVIAKVGVVDGSSKAEFEKHDVETKEKCIGIKRIRDSGGMRKGLCYLLNENINVRQWKVVQDP